MTYENIKCRWCDMSFEILTDCLEHERCHTDPLPKCKDLISLTDSDLSDTYKP